MAPLHKCSPEVREIAQLQRAVLPNAVTSRLSFWYTCAFYRFALRSPDEVVLVSRDGGRVVALAVATFAPKTLMRRLTLNTSLLLAVLAGLVQLKLWSEIADLIFSTTLPPLPAEEIAGGSDAIPELLILCTAPDVREQGHAGQLLDRVEALLRDRGVTKYTVRTFDDDDTAALRFYTNKGFTVYGRHRAIFSSFRLMEKRLVACGRAERSAFHPAQSPTVKQES